MGTILNGILGGVSGKVAGVVGANWKGIDYLRSYAIPANPNTPAQQTQRGKLSWTVSLARLVLDSIINTYWSPFATKMSGYNLFCRANLNSLQATPDYPDAVMAQGNLEPVALTQVDYDPATGNCNATYDTSISGNGLATDNMVLVIVDSANNVAFVDDGNYTRGDGSIAHNIGAGRTEAALKAYLFASRGSGSTLEVSNSDYIQVI